ncbi:ribosomal protein S12 methylthiotransferase accessory factor [Prauserella shujinwangii]|uniref:Ribosomal protein S12 methylthiotransferase accessory factor n=1 Tax=Prauserella shujinwangii TaxID=1453103 RepID=A0A2T0M310_9PSEU|nr:YcaO-like family protein [Prauserella shujinwangii]PRX51110.1 ribosomal protein S12 methylthiotransferase accessory factor [Prauserella shujinwangii]
MTARATLLERAVGWRQGVVAELRAVPRGVADVPLAGWAAVAEPFGHGGTSGGAAPDDGGARTAALAEALERYAAGRFPLSGDQAPPGAPCWRLGEFSLHSAAQRARRGFPHPGYRDPGATLAWTLPGNTEVWVPAGLVGLRPEPGLPATSSGLAAETSVVRALLRATQELVERDAFTVAWLHGLAPARVPVPEDLAAPVRRLGGTIAALDLTPAYSPHPVLAVAGTLPLGGRERATLGLACRADPAEALAKAWREWCQGTVFLSVWLAEHGSAPLEPHDVTGFDRHAAFYTGRPDRWAALPWWRGPERSAPGRSAAAGTGAAAELAELTGALTAAGIRLAYRELTTPELAATGIRAVRVLSPELVPLHADHRWPHLGGTCPDLARRFPGAAGHTPFPNPDPHPLG